MKYIIYFLFFSTAVMSCQIMTEHSEGPESTPVANGTQPNLHSDIRKDERYNLAEDRAKFDELRKDIPENSRIKNDERALYMEWMAEYKKEPSDIRTKFSDVVRKKRDQFNNDMNKIREEYNKDEKSRKDVFLKDLDTERSNLKDIKVTREKKADMYADIESKRKEFFSKLKDDRDSFETDYRQRRKDFEEYIKEKSDDFYSELKEYTQKFNELKKK